MSISSENLDNKNIIERKLIEYGINDFKIYNEKENLYIEFFKRVTLQPSCELEEDIYEELVKNGPQKQFSIELRRIDASPEDMPSETVFEYHWSVRTLPENLGEVLRMIEKIEKTYKSGIEKVLEICLEHGEVELDTISETFEKIEKNQKDFLKI
ncbi:MAG: hypothetical protein DRP10_03225 [Candidatus Aenigmatarchaeota archaeon]|nr:MAG: hypothetical protein DRP10_03225 [Candidatus Aenigmarchaeota archaeon]